MVASNLRAEKAETPFSHSAQGTQPEAMAMTPEQAEILAKLKEIEAQAALLLQELPEGKPLQRTRIVHIVGLSGYLRTLIGTQLTLVRKVSEDS